MQIGRRLQALRKGKKVSQDDLAKLADVHRTYVSMLERDERSPTVDVLARVCQALGIKLSEFFSGIENESGGRGRPARK